MYMHMYIFHLTTRTTIKSESKVFLMLHSGKNGRVLSLSKWQPSTIVTRRQTLDVTDVPLLMGWPQVDSTDAVRVGVPAKDDVIITS